jgi:hypothetical protein
MIYNNRTSSNDPVWAERVARRAVATRHRLRTLLALRLFAEQADLGLQARAGVHDSMSARAMSEGSLCSISNEFGAQMDIDAG